jgi:hypothetical protein
VPSVTWPQVLAWRMTRQFLAEPVKSDAVTVARRLAGVQAQVASSAALGITLRGGEPPAPELGVTLMKTWAMRGTLHLLPIDEAGAYLALCASGKTWEKASWQKTFGATPEDLAAIAEVARDVLPAGPLTREALTAEIVDRTGSSHLQEVLGSGWGTLLKPLAWWGVLCHGPAQGTKITFIAPSTLPGWRPIPPLEEASRTVIRAYLGAHGPATPEMFDNWLLRKLSRKPVLKSWFAAMSDELTTVDVEGVPMYVLSEHLDELLATSPTDSVRLLGPFDQYVLGAGTAYLIPAEHRAKVSRTAGWIAPVVLHQGRVAGTWDPETGEFDLWEAVPQAALTTELDKFAQQ